MRRDVVGLGMALAVGGLAYGAYRTGSPAPSPVAPLALTSAAVAVPPRPAVVTRATPLNKPRSHGAKDSPASIAAHVRSAAFRHDVPEALVAAVISVESEFNPRAVSHRGALGLMQLMPGTAALLGVRDAFDPRQNVDAGAKHLRDLLDRFADDVPLALAAYNAGAQAVVRHGGIPPYPETRTFVARVMSRLGGVAMPAVAMTPTPSAGASVTPRLRMARITADRLLRPGDDGRVVRVSLTEVEAPASIDSEARFVVVAPAPPPGVGDLPVAAAAAAAAVVVEAP